MMGLMLSVLHVSEDRGLGFNLIWLEFYIPNPFLSLTALEKDVVEIDILRVPSLSPNSSFLFFNSFCLFNLLNTPLISV